jgi:hypothetical protein
MRRLVAIVAVVMVMAVPSGGHIEVTMVPMPMPVADVNSHRADSDFDVFRYDYWFVAGVRRSGKCRHGQKRNNEKGKQSILHDTTLFGWGILRPDAGQNARLLYLKSVSD